MASNRPLKEGHWSLPRLSPQLGLLPLTRLSPMKRTGLCMWRSRRALLAPCDGLVSRCAYMKCTRERLRVTLVINAPGSVVGACCSSCPVPPTRLFSATQRGEVAGRRGRGDASRGEGREGEDGFGKGEVLLSALAH